MGTSISGPEARRPHLRGLQLVQLAGEVVDALVRLLVLGAQPLAVATLRGAVLLAQHRDVARCTKRRLIICKMSASGPELPRCDGLGQDRAEGGLHQHISREQGCMSYRLDHCRCFQHLG